MSTHDAPQAPPCCPNPRCDFHRPGTPGFRWVRIGFHPRACPPRRVQRYRCGHCRRRFSSQSFALSYWLRRPELLTPVFHRLLGCSAYRQIAREFRVSPATIMGLAARLGRHCLLVHEQLRPRGPVSEPLVLDDFISFEWSQYHPTSFPLVVGASHFVYGFGAVELRRSGRMSPRQRRRRAQLEQRLGRPRPQAHQQTVTALLQLLCPQPQALRLHSDDHPSYPRALRRLPHLRVQHQVTSSRAPRTPMNPLFPVNLLDLLIRHGSANHKRETIAFSKRRQGAVERLWLLLVWRNYLKSRSEQQRNGTPAMALGLLARPLGVAELLTARRFVSHLRLPALWAAHYRRELVTRALPRNRRHRLRYAF